jgi:hypothetical protein
VRWGKGASQIDAEDGLVHEEEHDPVDPGHAAEEQPSINHVMGDQRGSFREPVLHLVLKRGANAGEPYVERLQGQDRKKTPA